MKQRTERMGVEIRAALGEIIARGEIKDPRVRNAGLVTVTQVRVTGDLREARVVFTVHGADGALLQRTRDGLTSARSYLQQQLARRLRTRNTPTLTFEIDRALDHAFRLDGLLREVAATRATEAVDESVGADAGAGGGDDAVGGGEDAAGGADDGGDVDAEEDEGEVSDADGLTNESGGNEGGGGRGVDRAPRK
jgi:ribosome-binding factor A